MMLLKLFVEIYLMMVLFIYLIVGSIVFNLFVENLLRIKFILFIWVCFLILIFNFLKFLVFNLLMIFFNLF